MAGWFAATLGRDEALGGIDTEFFLAVQTPTAALAVEAMQAFSRGFWDGLGLDDAPVAPEPSALLTDTAEIAAILEGEGRLIQRPVWFAIPTEPNRTFDFCFDLVTPDGWSAPPSEEIPPRTITIQAPSSRIAVWLGCFYADGYVTGLFRRERGTDGYHWSTMMLPAWLEARTDVRQAANIAFGATRAAY